MKTETRLQYFPISFFSMIMGLAGLTLSIQKGEEILGRTASISDGFLFLTSFLFLVFCGVYFAKLLKYFDRVKEEFNHPIRLGFFPTVTISILLLSIGYIDLLPNISLGLWIVGTALHFVATVVILSQWIWQTKFEIHHFSPAWFIPIVGNILVPIGGTAHGFMNISIFFFSIGLIFWVVLFTIFLYRIVFHKSLPEKLLPTFFILIAPPSLAFISFVKLGGSVYPFGTILYDFALFLVIFLLAQFRVFSKVKFYLSSWAYSFPIAAFTVATALMYKTTAFHFYYYLFFVMLSLLTILIVALIYKTIQLIREKGICVKEE